MTSHKRYTSRSEISDEELNSQRETALRNAYQHAEFGEHINDTTAAAFNINGDITDNTTVLSTSLDRDNVFSLVSSYMGTSDEHRKASATVRDVKTDVKIRADIINGQVLLCPRNENVPYETFRDYWLFIENSLGITLTQT